MFSPEDSYKNDSTFRHVVDILRAELGYFNITPAELRQAAMLAASMHEAQRVRPLLAMFGSMAYDKWSDKAFVNAVTPSVAPKAVERRKGKGDRRDSLSVYNEGGNYRRHQEAYTKTNRIARTGDRRIAKVEVKPAPLTQHVFGNLITHYFFGDYRVCTRCHLSDVYIKTIKDPLICKS